MLEFALAAAQDSGNWLETVIGWFHDPETLLVAMGPWVLWGTLLIVFIESGVLFPVLPGDSLLFAAGLLHDQLGLNLWVLIGSTFVAAFLGAQVGYFLGWKFGRKLFKDDARVLKTEHLHQAEGYFQKYGGRSLVIGRFIPFVRTFIPLAAGIAKYPYPKFLAFNSLGSLLWGVGITFAGSLLGGVQFVHDNLSVIILAIVGISVLPMLIEFLLHKRREKNAPVEDRDGDGVISKAERQAAHFEDEAERIENQEDISVPGLSDTIARAAELVDDLGERAGASVQAADNAGAQAPSSIEEGKPPAHEA